MDAPTPDDRPIVACYLPTFLAEEMLHVYRQVTGLESVTPHVLTQKRRHADRFPFPEAQLTVLPRPPGLIREFRRLKRKHFAPGPKMLSDGQTARIANTLNHLNASALHIYFGNTGLELLPVLRLRPRPCRMIVSFHGADAGVDLEKPAWRDAMSAVFEEADAILARSESLATELRALGCPAEKITIQRAGIPLADWPVIERPFPAHGRLRLVQSGRLIEKKGYDLTLRALSTIRSTDFPDATLEILGEGPLRTELETRADRAGLKNAVHFRGFLDQAELRETYEKAHAFLHPSRMGHDGNQEGVPNAMLEAMATGLPVFATRHGGIPEACPDEWLVDEEDASGLAEQLRSVLLNEGEWSARSQRARQQIEEHFEQRAQIAVLEAIYAG